MSDAEQVFETRTYSNALKYITDLSPIADLWDSENWIFRGQREAEWGLMPSAFRPERWELFHAIVGKMTNLRTNQSHLILETGAVRAFAQAADRQGLPVPGFDETWLDNDAVIKNKYINDINTVFSGEQKFPLPSWRSLFGIAQHYGIPTRLLDWSESAKVSAYFSAVEAAELLASHSIDSESYIAVWALNIDSITAITRNLSERIISVRAPFSSNPNLRAQKGLFTLHEQPLVSSAMPVYEPLEKTIQRIVHEEKNKIKRTNSLSPAT